MRKSIKFCVLTVSLLLLVSSASASWTSKRLTNNSGQSAEPRIAASGAKVYVVWKDDVSGNNEVYIRKSVDNGSTWGAAQRLSNNAGSSTRPAVAVSGANVFVTWQDDSPGNREIYFCRSIDSGAAWKPVKQLTNNAGFSEFPRIAARGANVYVVWVDFTPGNNEIFFRRSADYGSTWQSARRMTSSPGNNGLPAIAVDGADVYLSWTDDTPGFPQIFFRRSANWGLSWLAARQISSGAGKSTEPAMATAGDGATVYIASRSDLTGNNEVFFTKSIDNGGLWIAAQQITFTTGTSTFPSMAADGTNVYLVWTDDTAAGTDEVYFKKSGDNGSTWGATQRLTFNTAWSSLPIVAVGATNIFVTYYDPAPGNLEIFLKYSPR